MSYDIWLTVDTGGPNHATVWDDWNYTSNCRPMWIAAGVDLHEFHGQSAGDCAPTLEAAIRELKARPEHYRQYDTPNRWGTYDTLVPAFDRLLAAFNAHPKATVNVLT